MVGVFFKPLKLMTCRAWMKGISLVVQFFIKDEKWGILYILSNFFFYTFIRLLSGLIITAFWGKEGSPTSLLFVSFDFFFFNLSSRLGSRVKVQYFKVNFVKEVREWKQDSVCMCEFFFKAKEIHLCEQSLLSWCILIFSEGHLKTTSVPMYIDLM